MRKTKKQIWFCDVCGKRGTAKYKEGDDIYTVLHLIEDSHRLTSPKCMQSTSHIRVITKNTSKEIVDEIMRRPTA
ncbi:MAG: hypothetical protein JW740_00130 [Candidatus Zambryskibacteria bacterium]|nr:hypothetical protein [Candidatus Zambryskibacteria bacterium]